METGRPQPAAFEHLVYDQTGSSVPVKKIGGNDFYVVVEDGFDYHIEAGKVDAAVWNTLKSHFLQVKDDQLPAALEAMGVEDPFTLAAYEAAIDNIGAADALTIAPEHKDMLALLGFRIVIDYHGDVKDVVMPEQDMSSEDDGREER